LGILNDVLKQIYSKEISKYILSTLSHHFYMAVKSVHWNKGR